jgi:hypothetical protein
MTILPAVVTITDLPLATTLSSAAVFEAVQTTNGVTESVQVSITQIMTTSLGALPAGGATGQLLGKASGTNYDATWVNLSSFVAANATSGVTVTGSTTLALSLASVAGLSVLGVAGTTTAIPLPIVGASGGQVLRLNDAGTELAFGAVNLASSAAATGVLPGSQMTPVNLATSANGGVSGVLPVPNGGSGTSAFSPFAVVLAGTTATSALRNAAVSTAGNILVDQGTAANPAFRVVGGDLTMSSAGTATIGTNVVSYAKIQQGTGLAVLGFATTAASNVTTIVAGAANQVLQIGTTGSTIGWGLPAQVLLNTLSPNGVATIGDTTSFSSSYRSYLITFENITPSNVTAQFQLQVATSGSTFLSSGYQGCVPAYSSAASTAVAVSASASTILLSGALATTTVSSTAGVGVSGFLRVFNPSGAAGRKVWVGEVGYFNASAVKAVFASPFGYLDSNNALTAFQFLFTPGNIATGTIKVYGVT